MGRWRAAPEGQSRRGRAARAGPEGQGPRAGRSGPPSATLPASLFLRSLQLLGFKTFARQTEIQFDGGVTAIVGPNGSGKTNIVDAVKWVLGPARRATSAAARWKRASKSVASVVRAPRSP